MLRWALLVTLVLCGCERSRACEGFELPPLSCGADGFEGTILVFDWRKPTVTADFGCGFEFDGSNVRIVPSGEVCTDSEADADAGGERRPFIVHCKLPDGTWDVGLPTGGSFEVKVERGIMNCAP